MPTGTTAVKLVLQSDHGMLWSCPKCKHGGPDREHTRIQGCRFGPRVGQQAKAKAAPKKKDESSSSTLSSGLVPGPVQDPKPLADAEGDGGVAVRAVAVACGFVVDVHGPRFKVRSSSFELRISRFQYRGPDTNPNHQHQHQHKHQHQQPPQQHIHILYFRIFRIQKQPNYL